ncbi:MAG: TonB-dependent receptor [Kiritimatiellae bacterium]|nr:TonB-dependent receptor [Kiritimatiellia bacterium]
MNKLIPAAFAAVSLGAYAAETNETVTAELPPVVVEASRIGKTPNEIPSAVQVITRGEIAASGARDVADLLQKKCATLDFAHLGANNPALTQLAPRGYGENGFGRLLVVVDGERLNNPDMNAPNLAQINLGAIERIEILQGSQNVLHGDVGSAGMINIVTDPNDYETHGHVELHGGSWNTIGASASLRGGVKDWRAQYWVNGGWDHSDGYRHNSGFDIYSVAGGVKQNFDNGSYIRLSAFWSDADYELPGSLTKAQWHHAPRSTNSPDDFYRRTTYGLNATALGVINEDNSVRLSQNVSRRHAQGLWGSRFDYDIYSYEFKPEWINTSRIGSFDNEFIAGTTFRYDRNDAFGGWTGKYQYYRQTMGFYAQDTFHLAENLSLEIGGRYERSWNENTSTQRPRRSFDMFAYDAALLFTPLDGLKTHIKFSNFYHMPFLDDISFNSGKLISPEHGLRIDAGFDWTFLEEFALAGNAYLSRTKDEIFFNPFMPPWGDNVNSPSPVMREGFDLRASWEKDKVAGVSLAYSFVDAKFDGGEFDNKDVPIVAKSVVSANGRVWLWNDCFVFGGYRYRTYCHSTSDFANQYERIPAFGLFNIGVQYSPTCFGLDGLTLAFTVDNLFDKNYCDYSTYGTAYWPGAGRSYMFTIRYEF